MTVSGGILAGGEGRRLGGIDKGWAMFRGRPFIAHALTQLRPFVDDITISANRNRERYAALGCPVVADRIGVGPLAGLLQLLEHARHEWLLCMPCDAVLLPPDFGTRLIDAQRDSGADIVAARDVHGPFPVLCLLRRELRVDLERAIEHGECSASHWQSRHRMHYADFAQPILNINDGLQLARAAAR
jgi:molybdenum cofactor guanylyltransferase